MSRRTPRRDMMLPGRKLMDGRYGTHYDSLGDEGVHGSCYDQQHCDCECRECVIRWERAMRPEPFTDGCVGEHKPGTCSSWEA